jgi:hypothetical protein
MSILDLYHRNKFMHLGCFIPLRERSRLSQFKVKSTFRQAGNKLHGDLKFAEQGV